MKHLMFFTLLIFGITSFTHSQIVAGRMNEVFLKTDLATNLSNPWEIIYGPDDSLWITEAKGYTISKIHPNGGARRTILNLSLKSTWLGNTPASDSVFNIQFNIHNPSTSPQGGFAGMAIHPEFNATTPKRFVYVSYVRSYVSTAANYAGVFFRNRIVRFTYNIISGRLENPVSLCDTLPGSSDHNSQRMIIAPVNGVNYLFYASGDMGAGQFGNTARPIKSQDSTSYEGKILRFNLEADGDAGLLDRWIPSDNPYNGTVQVPGQSAVWSTGMRNNQGFAYDAVKGILYGSSHGPFSDDEINIIQRGRNYGHPLVIGYNDGNYDSSRAATATKDNSGFIPTSLPKIFSENANATAIGSSYMDPIFSAYAPTRAAVYTLYNTYPGNANWPSEGWSGLDIYKGSKIPGWKNSLLMASLKWGRIVRTSLNAAGNGMVPINGQDTVSYFGSRNRFRDMAFSPNGRDLFVVMDSSTTSSGPSAANPIVPSCLGCVQKYTFLGYNNVSGTSAIPASIPIAAGKPNNCEMANSVTINAANNNNNLWVPITDTNSNVIAEINANGNNLGVVNTSMYINAGALREHGPTKTLYLDRNITITPTTQPSSNVSVRFYITLAELNALKAGVNSLLQPSNVTGVGDLSVFKNNDDCIASLAANALNILPSRTGTHGANGFYIQANISSFSSFYFANRTQALPVQLISFNGILENEDAQLSWSADKQFVTSYFDVERSTDGIRYTKAGTVDAQNNGLTQHYRFNDAGVQKLGSTVYYYRLKMVNTDGAVRYSSSIRLYPNYITGTVSLKPNPVLQDATLEIVTPVTGAANWYLSDNTGKTIKNGTARLNKGTNTLSIPMQSLSAGIYYLRVTGNNLQQLVKIQKQ